jgi:3'-phosphoadenosine 5'-phosphosulfate sulfotransferase (PAPS reductase)/FAD synthetase
MKGIDLDAIIASVASEQTGSIDLDAIVASVTRQAPAQLQLPIQAPPQSETLPGRGPDPKQAWLAAVGRRNMPNTMEGWSNARRQAAQGFAPDLRWYDVILVNTSAGKDSIVTATELLRMAEEQGVRDRLVMVHADLGFAEWEGTKELAEQHARILGLPFEVVRKPVDFLARIIAYGSWPSRSSRFCTGEYKTSEVEKLTTRMAVDLTGTSHVSLDAADYKKRLKDAESKMAAFRRADRQYKANGQEYAPYRDQRLKAEGLRRTLASGIRPVRFLNVLGLRAAEGGTGGRRHNLPPFVRKHQSNRTLIDTWLPIHELGNDEVMARAEAGPLPLPHTYACGMTRHSCIFCVMAGKVDLVNAALLDQKMLGEYVALEQTLTNPLVNPWHGDTVQMRDGRVLTVLARLRPGQKGPHRVVYTAGRVNPATHHQAVQGSDTAFKRWLRAVPDREDVEIEEWRALVRGGRPLALGRNKYLAPRWFPPMPIRQIAFIAQRLQRAGVDPRKARVAARQASKQALAEWNAYRKKNPLDRTAVRYASPTY